ncbi:MAG: cob(I)yrinic acid a,c-diamide adenosyltransferase [Proteobacteria bacterium]|nr:MAG: cob(I)yrinic acid a,c-diamide adenosyltransferase [Pseudomonadota bacterium]
MVKISKIYTRSGDDGQTGLVGGSRISKDSLKIQTVGDMDELNCWIGAVRAEAERHNIPALTDKLGIVQNDLFDIGAELATPAGQDTAGLPLIPADRESSMEAWIDELVAGLPELRSFILPGGSELLARLHLARAVCRRAERNLVALASKEEVRRAVTIYLNRLSDLLFAMARYESARSGIKEYLWKPGG